MFIYCPAMARISNSITLLALALIGLYPIWSYFLRIVFHVRYFPNFGLFLFMLWPLLLVCASLVLLLVGNRVYKTLGAVYLLGAAYLAYLFFTAE